MAERTAHQKHSCPACGAEAQWNPSKQALVCIYCGTEAPGELDEKTGQIKENDLIAAMRAVSKDSQGWKTERKSVKCQSCQAISVFEPNQVGKTCDFCGSAQLIPHDQAQAPIQPESLLPFSVDETRVREDMRKWYRSRWFAPNKLKQKAFTDTVHGVYLPYWTFDAQVHANWTAQSGYYYYTTETYRDSNGNTRTRRKRHTRWKRSSGSISHFFDDELVPGTKGVDLNLLRKIEPFPTKQLKPYDPGFLSGWTVEHYQIDLVAAAQKSRDRMDGKVRSMCASDVPGDTHRFLQVDAHYSEQTFKHILTPVWLLTYRYRTKIYQVLINGYTGEIAGNYPKSFWKIFLLVIFLATIGGLIAFFVNQR